MRGNTGLKVLPELIKPVKSKVRGEEYYSRYSLEGFNEIVWAYEKSVDGYYDIQMYYNNYKAFFLDEKMGYECSVSNSSTLSWGLSTSYASVTGVGSVVNINQSNYSPLQTMTGLPIQSPVFKKYIARYSKPEIEVLKAIVYNLLIINEPQLNFYTYYDGHNATDFPVKCGIKYNFTVNNGLAIHNYIEGIIRRGDE